MFNRRNPVCFTSALLSLSIILMMMMMIEDCDGSMAACNGSTAADCSQVIEDELEQEFLMDTEEHMRIMETAKGTPQPHLSYDGLQPGKVACKVAGCAGDKKKYLHRECVTYNRCKN